MRRLSVVCSLVVSSILTSQAQVAPPATQNHPAPLVSLAKEFRAWRNAEKAQLPDYGAQVQAERTTLSDFRRRIEALDAKSWSVHAKVDFLVLRSELDELDFELSVIRSVSRNPDFYTTQAVNRVMRHVGGRYQSGPGVTVPYDAKRAEAIVKALNDTPAIIQQAAKNLTETVGPMADMATERLTDVRRNYGEFGRVVGQYLPEPYRTQIGPAADEAGAALEQYAIWIRSNRARMTSPYAIGKKAFEWYVQRVLMMPYSSEDLLMQAEMERTRNWAFLEFERLKNRGLPQIGPAASNREFEEWKDATDVLSRVWADKYGLFTRPDDLGAMRDEDGGVWVEPFGLMGFPKAPQPVGTKREFLVPPDHWFSSIYWEKGHRMDPGTNHPHSDYPGHTFEGAVSGKTTCELRRGHNTRHDAWTNFMEEVQLQLEYPFVRGPRAREWMYGLAIMRAERVYVSVKFAEGAMTPEQVAKYYMDNVPDMEPHVAKKHEVWRKYEDPAQVLTYQVGKTQIFKLMMDEMKRLGDRFDLRAFDDALLATGQIPISLARWEMTGHDDEVKTLWLPAPLTSVTDAAHQHP